MNGWRAIMRTILRSYAFRGMVGFAVCPVPVLIVGLLGSVECRVEPLWSLLIVALFLSAALFGGSFPGWMLIDGETGRRRIMAALPFGATLGFLVPVFLGTQFYTLQWLLWPLMSSHIPGDPSDVGGVVIGLAVGVPVGFAALFLRPHTNLKRLPGFVLWLNGVVAFAASGMAAVAASSPWIGSDNAGAADTVAFVAFGAAFLLGGLIFGLTLDLLAVSTATQAAGGRSPARSRVAGFALVALVLSVIACGVVFAEGEVRHLRAQMRDTHGKWLMITERCDEAVQEFELVVRQYPSTAELRYSLANAYHKTGRYDDAIREYNEANRLKSDDKRHHSAIAGVYFDQKRYDEALAEYRELARLEPDDGHVHMDLAEVYQKMGRKSDAVKEINLALAAKPSPPAIYQRVAMDCVLLGLSDYAVSLCKDMIKDAPDMTYPYVHLAEVYGAMGRNDDANREMKEAIRVEPRWAFVRTDIARAYEKMGRYDDAIRYYKDALTLTDRRDADWAHFRLALLYDKLGRYDEAAAEYRLTVKYGRYGGPFDVSSPRALAQERLRELHGPRNRH